MIPFSFVYVPELLLQGTALEIAAAAASYLAGYAALAVAIQGTEFVGGTVSHWRRALFFAAAGCFLLPMILWIKLAGIAFLAIAWAPTLRTLRPARADP